MKVHWLSAALKHLAAIYAYIAQENEPAAIKLTNRILGAATNLGRHPGMGRPGRVPETRELVLADVKTVIAYRVKGETVKILGVYRNGQQWPKS